MVADRIIFLLHGRLRYKKRQRLRNVVLVKPIAGFEPATSSLP